MRYTLTVYVDTDENAKKWSINEVLDGVQGWFVEEGHAGCSCEKEGK